MQLLAYLERAPQDARSGEREVVSGLCTQAGLYTRGAIYPFSQHVLRGAGESRRRGAGLTSFSSIKLTGRGPAAAPETGATGTGGA